MTTIHRWSEAEIERSLDAIGAAIREGVGISLGIFEDVETQKSFVAVYQNVTNRWIRSLAQDYSMEWGMFVDTFGNEEYTYSSKPLHLGRLEVEIEGRKALLICPIQYFFAEGDEINAFPNLDHPLSDCFSTRYVWEDFVWGEIARVTEDIKTLYLDVWAKTLQEGQERTNVLSYYESQFDA